MGRMTVTLSHRTIRTPQEIASFWPGLKALALGGASVVALSLAAPPATAQEADAEDSARRTAVETLVVTARRREENLQDVPISISAFDGNRILELQADDISGIQYATPNLYLDEGDASNAVIYVRGVGQNDSLAFADPGVGVYVDDVFIARSQAAFLDLFDVERVEVLRGPQGTLYGRNTIGGAVKFISTTPPEELEGELEVGGGNFGFVTAKGRVGGPLWGDEVRGKVAFTFNRRNGYNDNVFTGDDDGDVLTFAGRGALLFEPTDDLTISLSVDGKIERPDSARNPTRVTPVSGFTDPNDLTSFVTLPALDDPFDVDVNTGDMSDISAYGITAKVTWDVFDSLTLESITSYRSFEFDLTLDTDGSPLPLLDVLVLQDQEQFTQELRATYEQDGLTVIGGLYYFNDDDLTFSGVDNKSAALLGFPVTAFGFATSSLADTDQQTRSYAAFVDATYQIRERWSVSAGLRYTFEERESRRRFENFFDPTISVIEDTPPFLRGVGVEGVPVEGEADFDALTPRFTVSYAASDDILVYGSASRGFKSGGFDGRANTDFGFQPFDPEFAWSYEGGVKTSWYDGRLVINGAYFYTDYTDLQVTSFGADPVTGVFVSQFTNAAEARIQGVEVEIFAEPFEGFALTGTVGYLDAEYQEFNQLVNGVVTDVSDRAFPNAPEFNASLGGTYEHPISDILIATLHADAAYRGETFTEITAAPSLAQDSYVLVNGFVSLRTPDDAWEIRAGVRNLTDEEIRVQGFELSAFPGVQTSFLAAPRTYDVRVFYRF